MSPLGTEALHKGSDFKHLLTILLVRSHHFSFLANYVHASELVGGNRQTLANSLGTS